MGLFRTAARTAVVAGMATRVHQRVSERQQGTWAAATNAPPPTSFTPSAERRSTMLAQLRELGELRTAGVLTDEEFEKQKADILEESEQK
jgi:Short C-terminal domain